MYSKCVFSKLPFDLYLFWPDTPDTPCTSPILVTKVDRKVGSGFVRMCARAQSYYVLRL